MTSISLEGSTHGSLIVAPGRKIGGRSGKSSRCEMPTGTHPDSDGNITQRHQVEPKRPSSFDTKGSNKNVGDVQHVKG